MVRRKEHYRDAAPLRIDARAVPTCAAAYDENDDTGERNIMPFWQNLKDSITGSQVWRSMFRHDYKDTRRNRALQILNNVFLHSPPSFGRPARHQNTLHMVHGRHHLFDVSHLHRHRRSADVLLQTDAGICVYGHHASGV